VLRYVGISIKHFIQENKLQLLWSSTAMPATSVYLLSSKNSSFDKVVQELEVNSCSLSKHCIKNIMINIFPNFGGQYG
jgi:hypothetical protein